MNQLNETQLSKLANMTALLFPSDSTYVDVAEQPTPEPVKATKSAASIFDMTDVLSDDVEQAAYKRTYDRVLAETGDPVKAALAAYGAINRMREGMMIKTKRKGDVVTVAGWGVMFGTPIHKDHHKTYFDASTNYFLKYYQNAPLWMEHGDDEGAQSYPIGYRTKTEVYPEHGIWIEHELDPSEEGFKYIDFDKTVAAVESGKKSYSSDSLYHHVQNGYKVENGHLSVWPLAGFSLVDSPAEPGLGMVIVQRVNEYRDAA